MENDLFLTPAQQRREREFEGMLNKKVGMASVSHRNRIFLDTVREWAKTRCQFNGSVSIEDVREWADSMELAPSHPNAWGCVFKGKHWVPCGDIKSAIPSAHHRRVLLWRYVP